MLVPKLNSVYAVIHGIAFGAYLQINKASFLETLITWPCQGEVLLNAKPCFNVRQLNPGILYNNNRFYKLDGYFPQVLNGTLYLQGPHVFTQPYTFVVNFSRVKQATVFLFHWSNGDLCSCGGGDF